MSVRVAAHPMVHTRQVQHDQVRPTRGHLLLDWAASLGGDEYVARLQAAHPLAVVLEHVRRVHAHGMDQVAAGHRARLQRDGTAQAALQSEKGTATRLTSSHSTGTCAVRAGSCAVIESVKGSCRAIASRRTPLQLISVLGRCEPNVERRLFSIVYSCISISRLGRSVSLVTLLQLSLRTVRGHFQR